MTVGFGTNALEISKWYVSESCLCAQMAPDFMRATAEVLRAHAEPTCWQCKGTGLVRELRTDEPSFDVANGNAGALFHLLGIDPGDFYGELPLADMARAVIKARALFEHRAAGLVRADRVVAREITFGLTESRLISYLDRLEALIAYARERKGTKISWA